MFDNVEMIYSEERGTWNVFCNNEWIWESESYEQAEQIFNSYFWPEEDYEVSDDPEIWEEDLEESETLSDDFSNMDTAIAGFFSQIYK